MRSVVDNSEITLQRRSPYNNSVLLTPFTGRCRVIVPESSSYLRVEREFEVDGDVELSITPLRRQ